MSNRVFFKKLYSSWVICYLNIIFVSSFIHPISGSWYLTGTWLGDFKEAPMC